MAPTAILDLDGTLVDTNYHHTLAWQRALRRHGLVVPAWEIHRHIGMGGDQLVAAVCGEGVEAELGDAVRADEQDLYGDLIGEVAPLDGARALIARLKERGHPVVLASSAKAEEVEHYLDLLAARDLADDWTTAADVEATKPEPDLVRAAIDRVDGDRAVLVGDTVWDCQAARRAGIPSIGVLTGGFAESELRAAGAAVVFASVGELGERLADSPLRS